MTQMPSPNSGPTPEPPPGDARAGIAPGVSNRAKRNQIAPWVAVALLAIHVVLALTAARKQAPAFDELIHLASGYSYWRTSDYRLHAENGNFPQRWAALPLLLSDTQFPATDQPAYLASSQWVIARQFFYKVGNDAERMIFAGRVMIVVLSVTLGWLVFAWSRKLFGDGGGLLSLAFYAVCPTVLSGATLVTSDMAMALALLLATGAVWRACHRVTPMTVAQAGAALGLLAVSKMSAPIIVPIACVMVIVVLLRRAPMNVGVWSSRTTPVRGLARRVAVFAAAAGACAVLAVFVIWASFGFRFALASPALGTPEAMYRPWEQLHQHIGGGAWGVIQIALRFRLLPEGYLYGFAYAIGTVAQRQAFLNGEYSLNGWWYFFPYTFLVKTPLAVLAALVVAIIAAPPGVRGWVNRVAGSEKARLSADSESRLNAEGVAAPVMDRLYPLTPLLVLLVVYWAAAMTSSLNIGHRHLLPTYPAMYILLGSLASLHRARWVWPRVVPAMLVVIAAAESSLARPGYLSYFNAFAGGSDGAYRHVVDSSLDWGQDLFMLRSWMRDRRTADTSPVYLSYFGSVLPSAHGVDAIPLPSYYHIWKEPRVPIELKPGWYCISATILQGIYQDPWGPWDAEKETEYQRLRPAVEAFRREHAGQGDREALASKPGALFPMTQPGASPGVSAAGLVREFDRFEWLRVGRLCALLRKREPDTRAGDSILIYRVSADELNAALDGPPPENRDGWLRKR